jgi:hypothetical protein
MVRKKRSLASLLSFFWGVALLYHLSRACLGKSHRDFTNTPPKPKLTKTRLCVCVFCRPPKEPATTFVIDGSDWPGVDWPAHIMSANRR